jgi:sortase A
MNYPYRYRYHKAYSAPPTALLTPKAQSRLARIIPAALITIGSLLIANVAWPILSYQLITSPSLQRAQFISPVDEKYLGNHPLATELAQSDTSNAAPQAQADVDFTNIRNWFPKVEYHTSTTEPETYTLDIPSLFIDNAIVKVGGESLNESLIHYPGTAQPGQFGTPVIFGHSVLRQFYNPAKDNPRRYVSIFSKIMTLKSGDRIYLDYGAKKYTYEVTEKYEVEPHEIDVLTQTLTQKELKLITCVPEGTYLRRGVIEAKLVDVADAGTTTVLKETGL